MWRSNAPTNIAAHFRAYWHGAGTLTAPDVHRTQQTISQLTAPHIPSTPPSSCGTDCLATLHAARRSLTCPPTQHRIECGWRSLTLPIVVEVVELVREIFKRQLDFGDTAGNHLKAQVLEVLWVVVGQQHVSHAENDAASAKTIGCQSVSEGAV